MVNYKQVAYYVTLPPARSRELFKKGEKTMVRLKEFFWKMKKIMMTPTTLSEFHQRFNDTCPHYLDAIQCVDLTPDYILRHELCQSSPATISLLTDTLSRLGHTPPCHLFGADELLNTIKPLPGTRLGSDGLDHIKANNPNITVDDRRHYVAHDLIPRVVSKLNAALNDHITTEEAESMSPDTLEAINRLSSIAAHLASHIH